MLAVPVRTRDAATLDDLGLVHAPPPVEPGDVVMSTEGVYENRGRSSSAERDLRSLRPRASARTVDVHLVRVLMPAPLEVA
jgi:hypothetical protein